MIMDNETVTISKEAYRQMLICLCERRPEEAANEMVRAGEYIKELEKKLDQFKEK